MHDHPARPTAFCWNQKYPRICGEKAALKARVAVPSGSPPRMRGKVQSLRDDLARVGITPAYARKSETAAGHSTAGSGSPPHMRGKEQHHPLLPEQHGITPAYAGKRPRWAASSRASRDHPRVCGEKSCQTGAASLALGSPPHVRGKVSQHPCSGL